MLAQFQRRAGVSHTHQRSKVALSAKPQLRVPPRPSPQRLNAASTETTATSSSSYEVLKGATVYKTGSGEPVQLTDLWTPAPGTKVVLAFLSHFGDLTSWEFGQKLVRVLPTLEASGVKVIAIGLGNAYNAVEFAKNNKFPMENLYADPTVTLYRQLGFNPGFMPEVEVSPCVKLLPMLAGIGSPGTVQEVLRGYVGDSQAKPVFDSPTPFDVLGTGYQRPFELATLRLFNMVGVLRQWGELAPDGPLLTQQGGCLVFNGTEVIFRHDDEGILTYADVDAVLRAALAAEVVVDDENV